MALALRRSEPEVAARSHPLSQLSRLNEQLARILDGWGDVESWLPEGFTPLADVEESDEAFLVEIELPSVKRDDISVEIQGRRLTVSGERKERERVGILRKKTRSVGRFHYEVVLPGDVEEDGVTATLDEGVLAVTVPKAASERPRRIPVE